MGSLIHPTLIKFTFEQLIDSRVNVEWESRRLTDTQAPVQVKTPGAFQTIFEFCPAEAIGFSAIRIVEISLSGHLFTSIENYRTNVNKWINPRP